MNRRRSVAVLSLSFLLASCSTASKNQMPPAPESEILENGLGAAQRNTFYHTSEGSESFPRALLESEHTRDGDRPFLDTLEDYGLIRDGQPSPGDPESLGYIGLTVRKDEAHGYMVGVNCAACHVGEIVAPNNGKRIRIDGAPNMFDVIAFFNAIPKAKPHFLELADRILDDMDSNHFTNLFHPIRFGEYVDHYVSHLNRLKPLSNGTPPLAGRADAFGAARAVFFGDAAPLTAPTSFPSIWGFQSEAYFHWNANTNSALERNLGQAIGLGATVKADCSSSVDIASLHTMETLAYKIQPPVWPEQDLGTIDRDKANAGKAIYMKRCAYCHDNYEDKDNGPKLPRHVYKLSSLAEVGTDPYEALNSLNDVEVDPSNMCDPDAPNKIPMAFGKAHNLLLGSVRDAAVAKFKHDNPDRKAEVDDWGDHRTDSKFLDRFSDPSCKTKKPTDCPVYPAKPLVGIWASPPYLHNGSVPTMMDLLTPANQRPDCLLVGQRLYDPVNMGYDQLNMKCDQNDNSGKGHILHLKDSAGNFLPGDSNAGHAGHEFGTDLSGAEKLQLIEFLKSLKPCTAAEKAATGDDTCYDQKPLREEFQAHKKAGS